MVTYARDPTPDLYEIMDKAGITGGVLTNSRRPIAVILSEVRGKMARDLKDYIEERERRRPVITEVKEVSE